ncbi:MAG: 9-O-acetylesterase [Sphingomonas sp.]|uniref:sialate O-acetylesterase n=1 Tax=Sphingomonas sp. TaxID=28214 RepID=UPI0025E31E45|nr:sialate O-acetylesterase [Sphingomonas sp.]MBX3564311.1 9-O-acetylesterase [Sphingomonas sp.]
MHRMIRAILIAALMPAAALAQGAPPSLHAMFQDHAVLQRDRPIAIWGDAAQGTVVTVAMAGNTAKAIADIDGHWRAELAAMPAGGPYTLSVTGPGGTATISDVLVGDVWLCSGQSNMEFQVRGAVNGAAEAAAGSDDRMRLLTVGKNVSASPERQFSAPVSWKRADPESVADFSAACYFMGRDLRISEKVPVGLINASWGGTAIDAWRSEASLAADPTAHDRLALLAAYRADPAKAAATFAANWSPWWAGKAGGAPEPWAAGAKGDWKTLPAFDYWETWGVGKLRAFNGVVFYRTEITLTAAQAQQGTALLLGPPDDLDMTWVNGIGVGTNTAWGVPRQYKLAPGTLKAGRNRLVVAIYDSWGNGGLTGTPEQRGIRLADGSVVPLPAARDWQYLVAMPSSAGEPPRAPWDGITGLAGIYNGMIAPVGPYGLRGVAWYQGEADTGQPQGYADKLAGMMAGWRGQFDNDTLPFLIVQLAGWGPRNTAPIESGTAAIRDQQRRAAIEDIRAEIVVTVDLGDVKDIHPTNKQDVGHRLARAARVLAYGAVMSPSGAVPAVAVREGDGITVMFVATKTALAASDGGALTGFELCGAGPGTCRSVPAQLAGETVRLDPGGRIATRVRYCWGDSPVCNLTDASKLPVTPFELAIQ